MCSVYNGMKMTEWLANKNHLHLYHITYNEAVTRLFYSLIDRRRRDDERNLQDIQI